MVASGVLVWAPNENYGALATPFTNARRRSNRHNRNKRSRSLWFGPVRQLDDALATAFAGTATQAKF